MKKMTRRMALPAAAAVVLAGGLVLAADVPADKAVIIIDEIGGEKGPVEFPHKKHVAEFKKKGGAAIVCKDCHHTLAADAPAAGQKVKACSECHVKVGASEKEIGGKKAPALAVEKTPGKIDRKSVIFHQRCVDGCHKEMKAEGKKITSCKTCHRK